jgi:hypothetical protein
MTLVKLRELERVEITVLVDNYTDLLLLESTAVAKRLFQILHNETKLLHAAVFRFTFHNPHSEFRNWNSQLLYGCRPDFLF